VWGVYVHQVAYLFALATGIVSSGMIGSFWAVLTDEAPHFHMLADGDYLTPIKAPVVLLSGPTTLMVSSFWWFIERPIIGLLMFCGGLAWSFVQGVFILTQLFGAN
jgi:hypothetical protein